MGIISILQRLEVEGRVNVISNKGLGGILFPAGRAYSVFIDAGKDWERGRLRAGSSVARATCVSDTYTLECGPVHCRWLHVLTPTLIPGCPTVHLMRNLKGSFIKSFLYF